MHEISRETPDDNYGSRLIKAEDVILDLIRQTIQLKPRELNLPEDSPE